ncbi:flagellar biosynthesis regulator FlaF [Minwuia sp.]|uniref:flagellar biosynthesis regulator FlaF n=1 Tax=Minwuia sp. TaxID=2493630 RepID=UPI003A93B4FB
MSLQAYSKAQRVAENPRDTEYRLFAEITRRLMDAKDLPRHAPEVINAVHRNKRLWSTLLADCSREGNALPEQTRASIISLAIWVDRHSSGVMRGVETLDDLIEVNRTIMEGLAQRPAAA